MGKRGERGKSRVLECVGVLRKTSLPAQLSTLQWVVHARGASRRGLNRALVLQPLVLKEKASGSCVKMRLKFSR